MEKRYSIERKQAVKEEKDIEDKHFAGEDNVYPTNYIDMSKLQKLQGIAVWDFSGEAALGNAESNIGNKTKIINTGFATLMNMDTIPFVYEDFHLLNIRFYIMRRAEDVRSAVVTAFLLWIRR